MSAKLRGDTAGKTPSELTRFKRLWLTLPESERDSWRACFASELTQPRIREEIKLKLRIKLVEDKQLTNFRQWLAQQDARDEEQQLTDQDEAELIAQGLTGDALRKALIEKIQRRAYLHGDAKTGLAAVDRGQKEVMTAIDREKLELLKRKAAQAEAAQEVTGSQLTPEEKEAEYRRIFGMT
jgi:hypothetical protein